QMLDGLPLQDRLRLEATTAGKLVTMAVGYLCLVALTVWLVRDPVASTASGLAWLFPAVVLLAFLFETMDSAAGMGFGTALAPLLLAMGHDPLQVVPVLLVSESVTGLMAATAHHE